MEKKVEKIIKEIAECNKESCSDCKIICTYYYAIKEFCEKVLPEDSIILTKAEKEKLLHEMYEQGRFDAIADLEKEGKVVLSKEDYIENQRLKELLNEKRLDELKSVNKILDQACTKGVEEFADFIKSQMGIERDYMGIKYKQGVFSDLDIDDFVKQFNNRDEEN